MLKDKELLDAFEHAMASVKYPSRAYGLYQPVEYTMEPGGKRLRPILCMRACEALCGDPFKALNQAMAVEMFHNFTLIHDDVMDGSDTRRGRPTVFAKWGATQAILSGDALLTLATQKAAECDSEKIPDILKLFNKTALEVYEGQQFDMDFEGRDDVTTNEYIEMIRLKTAVLLGCACAMGAEVVSGNTLSSSKDGVVEALYKYGESLGLAFQLRDDWLDTFGDSEIFGKPIGGDIRNRKKTWLFITAMSEAPADMAKALEDDDSDIVGNVTAVYESLNLSERCNEMISRYCDDAITAVDTIEIEDNYKKWFKDLAIKLSLRTK